MALLSRLMVPGPAFTPFRWLPKKDRHIIGKSLCLSFLSLLTLDERSSAYQGSMPSKTGKRASDKGFLGMSFELYLKLLDWTGRQIRRDHKTGRIPADLAPIMERIGLSGELWCDVVKRFGKIFKRVAGTPESLAQEAIRRGQSGYRTGSSPLPSAG